MQSADIPPDEPQRLAALRGYGILDTPSEGVFDELAELAAEICEAPIALVTLVDQSRQWFKARVGLEATETARSVAFCAHAILQPGLFVVPDTQDDERFADNPLVTGPPHIRFYAGAPLFSGEGLGLGTLCVIDSEPRELTPLQERSLSILRTHVMKLLELRRNTRDLADANRELEMYSYTISHDLRAPLRAISGYAEILREEHGERLGGEAADLLRKILDGVRRMDLLTRDILDLSRISHSPLRVVRVDLGAMAREAMQSLRNADPGRQVDVEIGPDLVAFGDPTLLRVVVENLLGNAWKFTKSRETARIEFGKTLIDGKQEFFVRDDGVGFEMAFAGKLFQPFRRLHAEGQYPGTGIGLATVKRILERHDGTVSAESTVDQGATFRFSLGTKPAFDEQASA